MDETQGGAPRRNATMRKAAAGAEDAGVGPAKARRTSRTRTKKAPQANTVSAEARRQMISEAAYFRAERRGFVGGNSEEDWLAAEAEIDRLLLG